MTDSKPAVSYASIHWRDSKTPVSDQFGDVYFSQTDGLEESRYVFIHHNRLAERWKQLNADKAGNFIILETGFGTGLNFLATWQLWDQIAPSGWTLHFLSIEKFPLQLDDLKRACSTWQQLNPYAEQLINNYPLPAAGIHTLELKSPDSDSKVQLHLLIGDVHQWLSRLGLDNEHPQALSTPWSVDAWFLDGFAPSKNPEMWNDTLYQQMHRLSKTNTTFATFTAAGIVRRGLQQAGFQVEKVEGFGRKREMLIGHLPAS